jgi:hypothetical protein
MYKLNITVFEDDNYDRLTFKQPEIISNDYKYIFDTLTNFILDYIYSYTILDKSFKSRIEFIDYMFNKYHIQDISDLNEIRKDYLKGMFIPFVIRYEITKLK